MFALCVIQNPKGTWSFVGRVPAALAYTQKDGSEPTAKQMATAAHCGPGIAGLKARAWATKAEALAAAKALGFDALD